MWGANRSRSQHPPLCIVPQRGKIAEDNVKTFSGEERAVFDKDEGRLNLANDSGEFEPEAASGAREPRPFACAGDVLAGKAARNDVNNSAPWSAVKGADVIPNRERREIALVLSV